MAELKPCPFCGGQAIVVANRYRHGQETYLVKCMRKECDVLPATYEFEDMHDAINAWNRRAHEQTD